MIEIIKKVMNERQMKNDTNTTIQLSSVFAKQLIREANSVWTGEKLNENVTEFILVSENGTAYTIVNRAYRDDTNHPDVEEAIIEALKTIKL
jgi:hypothetical protein